MAMEAPAGCGIRQHKTPSLLGQRVAARRKSVGLTQEALARQVSLNVNTIAGLEQGRIEDLSGQAVARVASALQVSTDWLLGRYEP